MWPPNIRTRFPAATMRGPERSPGPLLPALTSVQSFPFQVHVSEPSWPSPWSGIKPPAIQHDLLVPAVVGHRRVASGWRLVRGGHLGPFRPIGVPGPGLVGRALSSLPAEKHENVARCVVGERREITRGWPADVCVYPSRPVIGPCVPKGSGCTWTYARCPEAGHATAGGQQEDHYDPRTTHCHSSGVV